LRMEDMSSPRSEIEWINLSIGLRTHHPAERGVRAELSSASAETYLLRKDTGYLWGSGGGETTLSERLPCGHMGAFHSSGAVLAAGETALRADAGWDRNYREFTR
jgi:hypothetical protein